MAGFLEQLFGNADQTRALGLLGARMMSGDTARGFGEATGFLGEAEDRKLKRGLLEMQTENMRSEIEQRKAALEKQSKLQDMVARALAGGGAAPAVPGQLGSGSFGVITAPAGMSDMPAPRPRGIAGADFDQLVAIHALGGPNLTNEFRLAREGIERKPGSFYEDFQGRRQFIADPKSGIDFQNGRTTPIPGHTDFLSATTMATEGPKALLGSAARVNLRKNADGTERPVSELDENPTLRNLLSSYLPGQTATVAPARSAAPASTPPMAGGARPVIAPADQKAADAESITMIQAELQNPSLPADQKAGLQRELARLTASQSQPGFPTPTLARPTPVGQGYGKTTAQQNAEEVAKAAALEATKVPPNYERLPDGTVRAIPGGPADLKAGEHAAKARSRAEHAVGQANTVISAIDDALGKAGFFETGLTGAVMGVIPGTDAYDLRRTIDTVKANIGFDSLQKMREMSPTGGALGQVAVQELNMLQSTVSNMDANQSEAALKASLAKARLHYNNWKEIMRKAGGLPPDEAKPTAAQPLPANPDAKSLKAGQAYTLPNGKEAVWDGFRFKVTQ